VRLAAVAIAAVLAGLAACAPAEKPSKNPIFIATDAGWLAPGDLGRIAEAVPPPPIAGSSVDLADKAASARFVALEDSDRWLLATSHAELRPPLALQHFDCALGVRLGSAETPTLDRMAARAFHDANDVAEQVKARAFRARPVGDDPERRPCQSLTPAGRASASYPSGSAAVGTAYAELLARVDPERAEAVRRIGREIGLSRLVCAMHYPTDVSTGAAIGEAVLDQAAATPDFQAEVETARRELAAARATGRTNPGCAAERLALATPLP
jgi:acid phosphatase (class A)